MGELEFLKEDVKLELLDWFSAVQETLEKPSDRAWVLSACSVLDVQLEKILKAYLINKREIEEDLFRNQMPLGTFSAKITMCYYLGLISMQERKLIDTIRKIRNKFAHEICINSFEDSRSIMDLCNNLKLPPNTYIPEIFIFSSDGKPVPFEVPEFQKLSPKEKFHTAFRHIANWLNMREVIFAYPNHCKEFIAPDAVKYHENILTYVEKLENESKELEQEYIKLKAEKEEEIKQYETELKELENKYAQSKMSPEDIEKYKKAKSKLDGLISKAKNELSRCTDTIDTFPNMKRQIEPQINVSYDVYMKYFESIIHVIEESYKNK